MDAAAIIDALEPARVFVPARRDVAELSELADLEKVTVVSYNVLSQMGARRLQRVGDDHRHEHSGGYVAPAILTIAGRRAKLLRSRYRPPTGCISELLSYDADIMCLQEVDDYDDWWAEQLTAAGYDSVFAPRPSTASSTASSESANDLSEGLVTAFRRDGFQLCRSTQLDLNDVTASINDANLRARARQDNVALLLCLQPWETSTLPTALCVVNTQLAAGGPALEPVRVLQTEWLCRHVAVFNADFHVPIVMAGSFNALPSSDVYHVVHTGRRRPVPPTPRAPDRPALLDATATTITVGWTAAAAVNGALDDSDASSVLAYKVSVKNCTSAIGGFQHEVVVAAPATEAVVTMLSAGVTYQFRLAARNRHGWSDWSQPSLPFTTATSTKRSRNATTTASASADSDSDNENDKAPRLFVVGDVPPLVAPFAASFGSGWTPRFDSQALHLTVCPRSLATATGDGSNDQQYATLQPRGDRDEFIVHSEQLASAYANAFEDVSEPELTLSQPLLQATVDYIFYSTQQLTPFQVLALPSVDDLFAIGDNVTVPLVVADVEWHKHVPRDWRAAWTTLQDKQLCTGDWIAPLVFDSVARPTSWLPNAVYPSDHLALACVFAVDLERCAVSWH